MNHRPTQFSGLLSVLRFFLFLTVTAIAFSQISGSCFFFPERSSFGGELIYNPYDAGTTTWAKANFHAHSRSYGGLTNGKQQGAEVVRAYLRKGYRIAGLSDYFRINPAIYDSINIGVPVFEHGINPRKVHQLVIGATQPVMEDFFLFQNDHIRQSVLSRLSALNAFVCLAHPRNRDGYPISSMSRLTGYQAIEIYNGPHVAIAHWDSALSAGRPVWAMANDDIHDLEEDRFATSWNMVPENVSDSEGTVLALKRGNFYSVRKSSVSEDSTDRFPLLTGAVVRSDTVRLFFNRNFAQCNIVGQQGETRYQFRNDSAVEFIFNPSDTYLRAEVHAPGYSVFLNPFFRYDPKQSPIDPSTAEVDTFQTMRYRFMVLLAWLLFFLILFSPAIRMPGLAWKRLSMTPKPA